MWIKGCQADRQIQMSQTKKGAKGRRVTCQMTTCVCFIGRCVETKSKMTLVWVVVVGVNKKVTVIFSFSVYSSLIMKPDIMIFQLLKVET